VHIDEVARCAEGLDGVRRNDRDGLAAWRYHGRVVARQLDGEHLVIRADFGYREALVSQNPETFSVPRQFAKHMMVVADLSAGARSAIEDAIEAAWNLQRGAD
jgi:hypothetical protein